ncbi:MAG: tRNA pseudouridine(55) synthase TruB, partial [Sinomicrobium sp.]|nr:tRNA pseudouridine(55) synthase TruB [Sinomicrobium sp.]
MYTAAQLLEGQLLLIDKPLHWTSFQAVNKMKWSIRKKRGLKTIKVGHAGTLDPLATGLLLVCTGKFTKKIPELQNQPKEYTGIFTLGATTPSYDLETAVDSTFDISTITDDAVYEASRRFLGETEQLPPVFSALKQDGKRLYELAREGKNITVTPRKISITAFDITKINLPEVHFRVVCSKGTYIRALAHDFGKALNNGAYLAALCRTKIGKYSVADAVTPDAFAAQLQ